MSSNRGPIPHLRDIFPLSGYQPQEHHHVVDSRSIHDPANDSAISLGSTSEEESAQVERQSRKSKKSSKARDQAACDVKHLERHLSMKKTIRKKIMRELQQAWVEDPTEFRVEDIPRERLAAELNLESLSFSPGGKGGAGKGGKGGGKGKGGGGGGGNSFLEFLRGEGAQQQQSGGGCPQPEDCGKGEDGDSGHGGSPTRDRSEERDSKPSFWKRLTMRRTKR